MFPGNDLTLVVAMEPPTDVSSWSYQWQMGNRFGWTSGLVTKSFASGYMAGQSGITVTNSGQGIFNVQLNAIDTSGFDFKPYAYRGMRTNSGNVATLTEGFCLALPD